MAASGQVQALLDPNRPAEFEALLTALTTPDNQQRTAAEQALENVKPYPDQLSLQLATVLTSSNNEKAREMSAILLRQVRMSGSDVPACKCLRQTIALEGQYCLLRSLADGGERQWRGVETRFGQHKGYGEGGGSSNA